MFFHTRDKRRPLSWFGQLFIYFGRFYHRTTKNWVLSVHLLSWCSFTCYLREERVLCVGHALDCSDELLSPNGTHFLICAFYSSLSMFLFSNCIFNQSCILHQISFSYAIIAHFCETPKGHILLLLTSCCETLHSWEPWALQRALDSCQQGTGCPAEGVTGLSWHRAPRISDSAT